MDELLAIAQRAVELAQTFGASEADATATQTQRFATEARGATIAKLEQSTGRSLALRVFIDGRKATLATTDLSGAGLNALVREVVEAARFVARDPLAGVPQASPAEASATADAHGDLQIYAEDVAAKDPQDKMAEALAMESAIRAFDTRIDNSSGSRVSDATSILALANSRGFSGAYRASMAARGTSPVARDGATLRTSSYGSAARSYRGLERVDEVAAAAARRAVQLCGADKPKTMRAAVIFEREAAASVMADLFGALSAANVAVGNSFLIDRLGQRLGSELVTVIDDGLLPGGLGTAPFDAEGTPTRRTLVFERGVLRSYLYDTYYGRKLQAASTGNAQGSGGIGPTNFYLVPGEATLDELIATTKLGVLVLDTIGFSTESVTGTYSRGARGLMIENGEVTGPIDGFTIAGTLPEMFSAVDAVANDLRFDAGVVAPSFRVAEMTISGT